MPGSVCNSGPGPTEEPGVRPHQSETLHPKTTIPPHSAGMKAK